MMSLCLSLLPLKAHDHKHHHHDHKNEGQNLAAHVHGEANMSIAIDQKIIAIEYNGPAETILGFEHEPKTDAEKKLLENAKNKWEKDFLTLVSPDKSLNCKMTQSKFQLNVKDGHADIEAEAALSCDKSATSIAINMIANYPRIKTLKLDVLTAEGTPKSYSVTEKSKAIKIDTK